LATGGKQVSPAVAVIVIIIVLAIIVAVYFWAAGARKPTGAQPPIGKAGPGMNMPGGMPGGKGPMPGGPGMKVPVAPPTGKAPAPAPTGP
jgi:hypothetical protein